MFQHQDDLPVASSSTVSLSRSRSTKQRRRRANVNQLHLQVPLPIPGSPPSESYSTTSPASQPGGLPLTPSTSDDEFPLPPPINFNPRRAGRISPAALTQLEQEINSPSRLQHWEVPTATKAKEPTSPASCLSYDNDASGEDEVSDSEWYNAEFSKIISLRSPIPPNFPLPASETRRDSMAISPLVCPPAKRISKALPPIPLLPRRGSKKWRENVRIPAYPPPPPPTHRAPPRSSLPADCLYDIEKLIEEQNHLAHVSEESEDDNTSLRSPRPDTASDFSFAMYDIDYASERLDIPLASTASTFSRTLSHTSSSQSLPPRISVSPLLPQDISMDEAIPQESPTDVDHELQFCNTFDVDSLQFAVDLDRGMMLPLSLPSTPFEVGVESQLENIKEESEDKEAISVDSEMPAVVDDVFSSPSGASEAIMPTSPTPSSFSSFSFGTSPPSSRRSRRSSKFFYPQSNDIASSAQYASYSSYSTSYPTSPSSPNAKPRIPFAHLPYPPQSPSALAALDALYSPRSPYNSHGVDESRILKSKWSTSTLASIAEEHGRLGRSASGRKDAGGKDKAILSPSAKLRSYFRVSGSAPSSANTTSPAHKRGGSVSMGGVLGLRGLLHSQSPQQSAPSSPAAAPVSTPSRSNSRGRTKDAKSPTTPPSAHGHGIRRRGSVTPTVSDCGSESSAWSGSSTSSSGLRRKPIPLMLLSGAI